MSCLVKRVKSEKQEDWINLVCELVKIKAGLGRYKVRMGEELEFLRKVKLLRHMFELIVELLRADSVMFVNMTCVQCTCTQLTQKTTLLKSRQNQTKTTKPAKTRSVGKFLFPSEYN